MPSQTSATHDSTATSSPARGRFRQLPVLAGRTFLPLGLIARLPLAMLTVGALTLITAATDSYAAGGFAAGAVGIGSALGAPVLGYLADHYGQRLVLIASAALNAAAIGALLLAGSLAGPGTGLFPTLVTAFLMGATCPQIGPLARVRWMALTRRRPADLDTALSYESTADEATFVLGPALVGLLASLLAPWLPLALAALLTVIFVSAFAMHPTERAVVPLRRRAPDQPTRSRRVSGLRAWGPVALPVLGMLMMGTFFGSTQTALAAFAGGFGAATSAGLLYAVMGISSALAALSVAYWPQRISHPLRWLTSAGGMSAAAILLLHATDIPYMLIALLVLGVPVGPTMVSIFSLGSMVAPGHLVGTVMTLLASGIVAGTSIGASLAGSMADGNGPSAFVVPVAAAVVLFILGTISMALLRSSQGYGYRHG
ncbi:MFS transporter [Arthrobacter sp. JZ12]|uniref:MFS transporter n=1 Tax=Arthrobacter sp. JZ12 TaxID=2654190 RepID=UPI002B4902D8|nr:MFS transporter [Arthrobacter sp. JZ12]WRH25217.1 MFS transporter [Arthrobacter sp. JZ12]